MPSLQLRIHIQEMVTSLFELYAEFLATGTYYRNGQAEATVRFLVMPVPPAVVDGTMVLPDDEHLLLDAAELTAVDRPRPGDYIIQTGNNFRRAIVTTHLDLTGTLWTFVGRRSYVTEE